MSRQRYHVATPHAIKTRSRFIHRCPNGHHYQCMDCVRTEVERLWLMGWTYRMIGAAMGFSRQYAQELRKKYPLSRRRKQ